MKKIEGSDRNLRDLLGNKKYTIPYYQREFMWQTKQIEDLIDDLTSEFLEYYEEGHERDCVEKYGVYFMGSVVLAGDGKAIIDGQQRFTSLTLLLIYLYNKIKDIDTEVHSLIEPLIYSLKYSKKSFNIQVPEREDCMNAIFNNQEFGIESEKNESVKNLYARYEDIGRLFPHDKIKDDMILYFCDWLIEKVYFIEILATTQQDAHKIFVTMNDRGLSLTSTEMLKGYLLSEIKNDDERVKLNEIWKEKISDLKKNDDNGDDTFIKTWLRAQYAETIREGKAGAENKDFDIIGGPFHEWVRDEKSKIGLDNSASFESFIKEFAWFADRYMYLREAENTFNEESKYIYYNARVNFTLQAQLLLAPLCYNEPLKRSIEKMNLVARFIDLYIVSRFTNYKTLNYSTIKNYVFNLTKEIRRCSIEELKEKLNNKYNEFEFTPERGIPNLQLNGFTKRYIKNMLARVVGFIQKEIGVTVEYEDFMTTRKDPFEIEHIISNHYEWYTTEYANQNDFDWWRNNVGALLLLHKSVNASISDSKFEDKLETYVRKGNIYSESLDYSGYNHDPRFLNFINENNLLFRPYVAFGKREIEERNKLLIQLVELVWNNDMFF